MIAQQILEQVNTPGLSQELLDCLFNAVCFVDGDRKVVYWNRGAERLTGFRREAIVGKPCCEDILLHIDTAGEQVCSGFHPVAQTLEDGQPREAEAFLRHREGHLVAVRTRVSPITDADGKVVGAIEVLCELSGSAGTLLNTDQLEDLAFVDPQTNLASRRYLEMRLLSRFEEMQRYGWSFGVIIASVDNADQIRKSNGPYAADTMIEAAAKTFANTLRSFDTVGRWNDSEFLAIVPVLEYADLYAIGERIRTLVEQSRVMANGQGNVITISVGAAAPEETDSIVDVVKRAHDWMEKSRQTGGNRTSY